MLKTGKTAISANVKNKKSEALRFFFVFDVLGSGCTRFLKFMNTSKKYKICLTCRLRPILNYQIEVLKIRNIPGTSICKTNKICRVNFLFYMTHQRAATTNFLPLGMFKDAKTNSVRLRGHAQTVWTAEEGLVHSIAGKNSL